MHPPFLFQEPALGAGLADHGAIRVEGLDGLPIDVHLRTEAEIQGRAEGAVGRLFTPFIVQIMPGPVPGICRFRLFTGWSGQAPLV